MNFLRWHEFHCLRRRGPAGGRGRRGAGMKFTSAFYSVHYYCYYFYNHHLHHNCYYHNICIYLSCWYIYIYILLFVLKSVVFHNLCDDVIFNTCVCLLFFKMFEYGRFVLFDVDKLCVCIEVIRFQLRGCRLLCLNLFSLELKQMLMFRTFCFCFVKLHMVCFFRTIDAMFIGAFFWLFVCLQWFVLCFL